MRYFVGFVGFPLGLVIVIYRERVKRFTGDFGFAESWFGPGGTYTAILIFGLIVSLGSLMYALGTLQALFIKIFSPFL
ncbi:hypothetical protein HYW83_00960 [Candidatus Peregrinibacteria bacterium]|nr:hypothetical protein [Candidatus Peregrinibacteria bacterium]